MGSRVLGIAIASFFLLGGIAFVIPEGTRGIGIGQIWIAVGVLLILVFLFPGQLRDKFRSLFQKTQ
jgi:hypothetical protein